MQTEASTLEAQALIANDIRVLIGQLNVAIQRAAANKLAVQITTTGHIDVRGPATYYPVVSARILSEVQ